MVTRGCVRHLTPREIDDAIDGGGELDVMVVEEDDFVRLIQHGERHRIVDLQRRRNLDRLFRLRHLHRGGDAAAADVAEGKGDASVRQHEDIVPVAAEMFDRRRGLVQDVERETFDDRKVRGLEALHQGVDRGLLRREFEAKGLDRARFAHGQLLKVAAVVRGGCELSGARSARSRNYFELRLRSVD